MNTTPILRATNIVKKLGGKTILNDVSLDVHKGDVKVVIGPSGAGKSTFLQCLNYLLPPDAGDIWLEGNKVNAKDTKALCRFRQQVGMIFQDFNLFDHLTAEENVSIALRKVMGFTKAQARDRALTELSRVGLGKRAALYPAQLSGGQKQRVAIARALATNPKVLLCDEATSALDPATTESILALIKDINRRLGITAVIITHEMSVIEKICNQVAIISHGRIAESGSVEEVFFHPRTEEARQLVIPEAMQPEQMPHERLYRIIFNGRSSFEPVIGNLVLECGAPVNIMYADTRDIGGTAFGQMVLQLPDDEAVVRRILAFAESKGLMLEEMNHV